MDEDGDAQSGSDCDMSDKEPAARAGGSKQAPPRQPAAKPLLLPSDDVLDLTPEAMPPGFGAAKADILRASPAKQKHKGAEWAMAQYACLEMGERVETLKKALQPLCDRLGDSIDVNALLRILTDGSARESQFRQLALGTLHACVTGHASSEKDVTARLLEQFGVLKPDSVQKKVEDALRMLDRLVLAASSAQLFEPAANAVVLRRQLEHLYTKQWLPLVEKIGHKEAKAFLERRHSLLDPISDETFTVITEMIGQKQFARVFAEALKQGQLAPARQASPEPSGGRTYADVTRGGGSSGGGGNGNNGSSGGGRTSAGNGSAPGSKQSKGPRCFNCNGYGHVAGDCTEPPRKNKKPGGKHN